uniref:Uncharacterized protein n=1 Tax=Plectus sambesii TaxID=2011161 RepID=A0A914X4C1_9BILA
MFRDYWLLEVFYALAESNRKEHYDKVLSRVKDFKFKPKMHFISRLISLGNYEAAMSFQNFAASTKAEDDSSVRDTAVILRAMSWAFHRATAADEDSLNTLSSTIATALNAMDSNRGSSSSSKNVPVAIHWDMFLRFVARMATGGTDSLGPALKSLTAKINKKLKFSRKQMTKLEELYSSLGLTEALPHAGQRTPQFELNVDEDRVQSLIDADVADAKRTPKAPKPAVNRRRPVGDRTLDVKVNEEGIQELIDANALPSSGKITRRPQKSNEMLNSIEEQFAEGLVNADFESLQSPRRRRTPPAAKLTKREKKPEDPDDITIRDLVREDKLEDAFNKALELSKQRERVPGHYYLLKGALVSNDSKFLQKLMQLLNVKNGETNSLTDFLYVLLDLNKLAVAKKLITGANVELKPTKLAYLTSKACDDDKPHILSGFLDLTSDSKIIDAISRDAIYGKLIFYHCTQMDERNLEATVARIRDEKLELSDKRRTQIAMAMRAFGKPNPFKDSSPPSPSFDASFLPKGNSPSQRPESSL